LSNQTYSSFHSSPISIDLAIYFSGYKADSSWGYLNDVGPFDIKIDKRKEKGILAFIFLQN
jgi:hypothetical protein